MSRKPIQVNEVSSSGIYYKYGTKKETDRFFSSVEYDRIAKTPGAGNMFATVKRSNNLYDQDRLYDSVRSRIPDLEERIGVTNAVGVLVNRRADIQQAMATYNNAQAAAAAPAAAAANNANAAPAAARPHYSANSPPPLAYRSNARPSSSGMASSSSSSSSSSSFGRSSGISSAPSSSYSSYNVQQGSGGGFHGNKYNR